MILDRYAAAAPIEYVDADGRWTALRLPDGTIGRRCLVSPSPAYLAKQAAIAQALLDAEPAEVKAIRALLPALDAGTAAAKDVQKVLAYLARKALP